MTSVSLFALCRESSVDLRPEASVDLLPEADGGLDHECDLRRHFLVYSIIDSTIILTVFPLNDAFGSLIKKCKQKVLLCGEHLTSAEMKMSKTKCSISHPADHYPASSEIDKGMGDTALTYADLGPISSKWSRRAIVKVNTKAAIPCMGQQRPYFQTVIQIMKQFSLWVFGDYFLCLGRVLLENRSS